MNQDPELEREVQRLLDAGVSEDKIRAFIDEYSSDAPPPAPAAPTGPEPEVATSLGGIGRSLAGGLGKAALDVGDLAALVPSLVGMDFGAREKLQSMRQGVDEWIGPQSKLEKGLEFGAELVSAAVPYAKAAKISGFTAKLFLPRSGRVFNSLRNSIDIARHNLPGTIGQHVAGTVVGGIPLNIAQVATMPGATTEDKQRMTAIGLGADVVGGAIGGVFGRRALKKITEEATAAQAKRASETALEAALNEQAETASAWLRLGGESEIPTHPPIDMPTGADRTYAEHLGWGPKVNTVTEAADMKVKSIIADGMLGSVDDAALSADRVGEMFGATEPYAGLPYRPQGVLPDALEVGTTRAEREAAEEQARRIAALKTADTPPDRLEVAAAEQAAKEETAAEAFNKRMEQAASKIEKAAEKGSKARKGLVIAGGPGPKAAEYVAERQAKQLEGLATTYEVEKLESLGANVDATKRLEAAVKRGEENRPLSGMNRNFIRGANSEIEKGPRSRRFKLGRPAEPDYPEMTVWQDRAKKVLNAAEAAGLNAKSVIFDEEMGFTPAGRALKVQFIGDDARWRIRTVQDIIDYRKPLPKAMRDAQDAAEEAARASRLAAARRSGIIAQSPGSVGGSLAGMLIASAGTAQLDVPEEERKWYVLAAAGIGAAIGHRRIGFGPLRVRPDFVNNLIEKNLEVPKTFANTGKGIFGWLRSSEAQKNTVAGVHAFGLQQYAKMRPSEIMAHVQDNVTKNLPTDLDLEIRAAVPDVHVADAHESLTGTFSYRGVDGTRKTKPEIMNMTKILSLVGFDQDALDAYRMAKSLLEREEVLKDIKIEPAYRTRLEQTRAHYDAIPAFKLAAENARAYDGALVDVLAEHGRLSPEAVAAIKKQQFYAPLLHEMRGEIDTKVIFGPIAADDPLKAWKSNYITGNEVFKSPTEVSVHMTSMMTSAASLNSHKMSLAALATSMGEDGKFIAHKTGTISADPQLQGLIERYKKHLNLNPDDTKKLRSMLGAKDTKDGYVEMQIYVGGALETWRFNKTVAEAYTSMSPKQRAIFGKLGDGPLMKALGEANKKVTGIARVGIVLDPVFKIVMAFMNEVQGMLNQAGDVVKLSDPSTWGSLYYPGRGIYGYLHALRNTKDYQEALSWGAGAPKFDYSSELKGASLRRFERVYAPNQPKYVLAGRQIKAAFTEHSPGYLLDAYKTLSEPMQSATAVTEYLRLRNAGWEPARAAFLAAEIGGNYQQTGLAMEALAKWTLFGKPTVAANDKVLFESGMHPFRSYKKAPRDAKAQAYMMRGVAMVTLPTLAYMWVTRDDQELEDIRNSEEGKRVFPVRGPGGILKIPLYQMEGSIFHGLAKGVYRTLKNTDDKEVEKWMDQVAIEATPDLMPIPAQVAYTLFSGKSFKFGNNLVPGKAESGIASEQGGATTTQTAEELSAMITTAKTDPTTMVGRAATPAGIDFLVRSFGGTLATTSLQVVDVVRDWASEGYVPPAAEFPMLKRFLQREGNLSIAPVEKFYENLAEIDRVATTWIAYGKSADTAAMQELEKEVGIETIARAMMYRKFRDKLSTLRQAYGQIDGMPAEVATIKYKRSFRIEMQKMMIDLTREALDSDKKLMESFTGYEAR